MGVLHVFDMQDIAHTNKIEQKIDGDQLQARVGVQKWRWIPYKIGKDWRYLNFSSKKILLRNLKIFIATIWWLKVFFLHAIVATHTTWYFLFNNWLSKLIIWKTNQLGLYNLQTRQLTVFRHPQTQYTTMRKTIRTTQANHNIKHNKIRQKNIKK